MSKDNHVKNYVLERHSSREIDRHRVNENDMQIIKRVKGVFVTDGWLFVCWDFGREGGSKLHQPKWRLVLVGQNVLISKFLTSNQKQQNFGLASSF